MELLITEEVFSKCLQLKTTPTIVNKLLLGVEYRKVTHASLILGIPDFIYNARHNPHFLSKMQQTLFAAVC